MPAKHLSLLSLLAIASMSTHMLLPIEAAAQTIPAAASSQPRTLWRLIMEGYYGPYDKQQRCWISRSSGQAYCMRPHRLDQVSIKGVNHLFIVVGGSKLGENGEPQTAHVDAGAMGLMIFRENGPELKLVARNDLHSDFGSFGSVPAEDQFAVREIGPNDTYGWVANDGWFGQGITFTHSYVFAAIGDTITNIGGLPYHFDNSGNCENGKVIGSGEPCSDYSFSLMFDSLEQNARFYPAVLKVTGTREGTVVDQMFTTTFDATKFTYGEIKGLPKEFADGI